MTKAQQALKEDIEKIKDDATRIRAYKYAERRGYSPSSCSFFRASSPKRISSTVASDRV